MERDTEMNKLDNTTPVTVVSIEHIREQIRIAEIDVAEATMRRDMLRFILELRQQDDPIEQDHLNRTRAIIAKFYA
jgi:hypothetical protein